MKNKDDKVTNTPKDTIKGIKLLPIVETPIVNLQVTIDKLAKETSSKLKNLEKK